MTFHLFPVMINIAACALIILRLIAFPRNGRRHKPTFSILAWLLAVSCCMVIVSLLLGYFRLADWAEVVINCIFCISINLASGNLSTLLRFKD